MKRKYLPFLLISFVIIVTYSISEKLTYILACVFFAFLAGWIVVQGIRNYIKARQGVFTKGKLVSVSNTSSKEEGDNKEGESEVEYPNNSSFSFVWWVKLVVFLSLCLILLYLSYSVVH